MDAARPRDARGRLCRQGAGRRHDGVSPRDAGRATRPTTETRGDKRGDARGDGSIHLRRRRRELRRVSQPTRSGPVRPRVRARGAVPERPAEFDARGPAGRPGRARRAGRGDVFRRGPRSSVLGDGRDRGGPSVRLGGRRRGTARRGTDEGSANLKRRSALHEYHHYQGRGPTRVLGAARRRVDASGDGDVRLDARRAESVFRRRERLARRERERVVGVGSRRLPQSGTFGGSECGTFFCDSTNHVA